MNHWVKKAGIINNEGQMIPLPPPNFHAFFKRIAKYFLGCALAKPVVLWRPTFAPRRLENLGLFIQIMCWAP